jgi:hypothetical protein
MLEIILIRVLHLAVLAKNPTNQLQIAKTHDSSVSIPHIDCSCGGIVIVSKDVIYSGGLILLYVMHTTVLVIS